MKSVHRKNFFLSHLMLNTSVLFLVFERKRVNLRTIRLSGLLLTLLETKSHSPQWYINTSLHPELMFSFVVWRYSSHIPTYATSVLSLSLQYLASRLPLRFKNINNRRNYVTSPHLTASPLPSKRHSLTFLFSSWTDDLTSHSTTSPQPLPSLFLATATSSTPISSMPCHFRLIAIRLTHPGWRRPLKLSH